MVNEGRIHGYAIDDTQMHMQLHVHVIVANCCKLLQTYVSVL